MKTTYIVKCTGCKKDENGNVIEVYGEYDPETRAYDSTSKVNAELFIWLTRKMLWMLNRLYDNLFTHRSKQANYWNVSILNL